MRDVGGGEETVRLIVSLDTRNLSSLLLFLHACIAPGRGSIGDVISFPSYIRDASSFQE